jgi:hypothetical protein
MKSNKSIWLLLLLFIFAISSASVAKKGEAKTIDCGTDLDCFIEASKNCEPSKVVYTLTVDLFGASQTTTTYLEIKGLTGNKCILYVRRERVDVDYSDELIQKMLSRGSTREQLEQQKKEANEIYDATEGSDGTCQFKTSDLTAMLQRWKGGIFATSDWEGSECKGEYFGEYQHVEVEAEAVELSSPKQISPANGAVFSHYPRKTTLKWHAVSGAKSYTVEIDCFHCCTSNKWCTEVGRTWKVAKNLTRISYTFNFIGAQPGRWRVWAVGDDGQEGPKSEWWEFQYTR